MLVISKTFSLFFLKCFDLVFIILDSLLQISFLCIKKLCTSFIFDVFLFKFIDLMLLILNSFFFLDQFIVHFSDLKIQRRFWKF